MQRPLDASHVERCDPDPGDAIPLLDGQLLGHQRLHGGRIIGPVQKRQVAPGLEIHWKPHKAIGNASAHETPPVCGDTVCSMLLVLTHQTVYRNVTRALPLESSLTPLVPLA